MNKINRYYNNNNYYQNIILIKKLKRMFEDSFKIIHKCVEMYRNICHCKFVNILKLQLCFQINVAIAQITIFIIVL